MNTHPNVNKKPASGQELEKHLEDRLREILGSITWIEGWDIEHLGGAQDTGFDFTVEVRSENGLRAELFVECKEQPRPAQFPFKTLKQSIRVSTPNRNAIPVVAAPAISERMAELCRKEGWSWFDLAGNCLLNIPGGVWIERSGLRSKRKSPKPEANLGTTESARILRSLLGLDTLERKWTQRELQESCVPSVSLGLVNKVVRYLREQAYIEDLPEKGGFRLIDPAGLLREWQNSYQFRKHSRSNLFTLKKTRQVLDAIGELEESFPGSVALASFSAAEQIDPQIRGESKMWIYVRRDCAEKLRKAIDAQEVDTGPNLCLIIPEDDGVFFESTRFGNHQVSSTSLIQTYLDLLHSGGRGQEAAEALLERHLKPIWKNARLQC